MKLILIIFLSCSFFSDKRSSNRPMHSRPYFLITPANFGHSSGSLAVHVTVHPSLPNRYIPFLHGIQSLKSILNIYLSPVINAVPSQLIKLFYHPEVISNYFFLCDSSSDKVKY